MALDHERLVVYRVALDFLSCCNEIIEALPRGRSYLADQFSRASLSIVLNLAEGTGKHTKGDQRRYFGASRGSAAESAALLDVCLRLGFIDETKHAPAKKLAERIVAMLVKLIQHCE